MVVGGPISYMLPNLVTILNEMFIIDFRFHELPKYPPMNTL